MGISEKRDELQQSFKHPAPFYPQIQQRQRMTGAEGQGDRG
jgi:hypothetical protein